MEDDEEETFAELTVVVSETTEAEKEFAKILDMLREAEGMKLYSDVYAKLYDSYFMKKEECAHYQAEIKDYQHRMNRFDSTVQEYTDEVSHLTASTNKLKEELAEAKALADAMHERELHSVESLETMRKLVLRLEKELDARKHNTEEDAGATSAAKEKEKFEKEKARLSGELEALRARLLNALAYHDELEQRNAEAVENIALLEEQLEDAGNNAVRQGRLVDHLNNEVKTFKNEIENRVKIIATTLDKLAKCEKMVARRDKQVRDLNARMAQAAEAEEAALAKAENFRTQLDTAHTELENAKQERNNANKQFKMSEEEGTRLRMELSKLNKSHLTQLKKYQLLEVAKAKLDTERNNLRNQVGVMEREMGLNKKQAEADKREIENINREKDILKQTIQKIQFEAQENLQMLQMQEQRKQQLQHELEMNEQQINKQRAIIRQLEKDKDRMLEETIALNEKIDEISEEVRLRNADIVEQKKCIRESAARGRKCSVALDACRADRNMLHKNYTEALDEIHDLKHKMKMLLYQIEQLKEDITSKEVGLKACAGALGKCQKRVEAQRAEAQAAAARLGEARADLLAARQEHAKLLRIIQEGDAARARLSKEMEGLMNERDVVGAQLVRRNDEVSLLYEKIRIGDLTLQRGERQYEQRVEDIRLLRLEILRLRKEKNLLSKGIENMTDLRLEVFNLEREVGRERLRVRALEEALETPINVHRWRKLQGTDPESVVLTQKLRMTQKKVLSQSEMLVLKDRELKETKNLYAAVKDMLALQPSPEIQRTLNQTQRALTHRTAKMRCLIAELNMREKQVTDLRLELDRATGELTGFKQKYYEMKRALDADEARRLRIPSPVSRISYEPEKCPGGCM